MESTESMREHESTVVMALDISQSTVNEVTPHYMCFGVLMEKRAEAGYKIQAGSTNDKNILFSKTKGVNQ